MDIGQRMSDMGRGPFALVVVTAILSIGGIAAGFNPALDGHAWGYTRIALGAIGLAGALLVLLGIDFGKTGLKVIMVWAAIQCLYFADTAGGNYTRQLSDILIGFHEETVVNGEVTSYSDIGVNALGVVMLGWASASKSRIDLWRRRSS